MRTSMIWGKVVPIQTTLSSAMEASLNLYQYDYRVRIHTDEFQDFTAYLCDRIARSSVAEQVMDYTLSKTQRGCTLDSAVYHFSAVGSRRGMLMVSQAIRTEFRLLCIRRLDNEIDTIQKGVYPSVEPDEIGVPF